MQLTYKLRIHPTVAQETVLWALSEKCRLINNFALAERIATWEDNKEKTEAERISITYLKQQNNLPALKQEYPEYKWVYSKVLQGTLRKLDENLKSFFALNARGDTGARPPRFKGNTHFTTLCYNQSGFKIDDDILTLAHKHPSKVRLAFRISGARPKISKVKQVDLFQDKHARWFVSIVHEVANPPYLNNGLFQAFDLGIVNIASGVNSHGEAIKFANKRPDKYWKKMIEEVQSRRDHCQKFSKRWHRYTMKLSRMRSRCAAQLKDYQHWVSRWIVDNTRANAIIIGDLHVKDMARKQAGTGNPRQN